MGNNIPYSGLSIINREKHTIGGKFVSVESIRDLFDWSPLSDEEKEEAFKKTAENMGYYGYNYRSI